MRYFGLSFLCAGLFGVLQGSSMTPVLMYSNPKKSQTVTLREARAIQPGTKYLPESGLNTLTKKFSHVMTFGHRQLDLADVEDRVSMEEAIQNLTAIFEGLPKAIQVATGPNFGSLIRVMHAIKREFQIMDMEIKTGRKYERPTEEDTPLKNLNLTELHQTWLPVSMEAQGEVFREAFVRPNLTQTRRSDLGRGLNPNVEISGQTRANELRPIAQAIIGTKAPEVGTKRNETGSSSENVAQTADPDEEPVNEEATEPMAINTEPVEDIDLAESQQVNRRVKPPHYKTMIRQGGRRTFRKMDKDAHFVPSIKVPDTPRMTEKSSGIYYSNRPISDKDYLDRKLMRENPEEPIPDHPRRAQHPQHPPMGMMKPHFHRGPQRLWNQRRRQLLPAPPPLPAKIMPLQEMLNQHLMRREKIEAGAVGSLSRDSNPPMDLEAELPLRPGQVLPIDIQDDSEGKEPRNLPMPKTTDTSPSVQEMKVFTPTAQFVVSSSFTAAIADPPTEVPDASRVPYYSKEAVERNSTANIPADGVNLNTSETQRTHIVYSVPVSGAEYSFKDVTPTLTSSSSTSSRGPAASGIPSSSLPASVAPTSHRMDEDEKFSTSSSLRMYSKRTKAPVIGPQLKGTTRAQHRRRPHRPTHHSRGPRGPGSSNRPRADIHMGGEEQGIFNQIDQSFKHMFTRLTGWASGMPLISNLLK